MHCIRNLEVYNRGMAKSLEDKLFFLNHLPMDEIDSVLDYGCGDGTILSAIRQRQPHINCIGYDNNPDMFGYGDFDEALANCDGKKLLILSSVVHEVYSYWKPELFWEQVLNSGFDYIALRDMSYTKNSLINWNSAKALKSAKKHSLWEDYLDKHDGHMSLVELQQFFMKYRYVENWERESVEDYLPIDAGKLKSLFELNGYNVEHFNTYCLEFLKRKVMRDFGIQMPDTTHVNLIARLK